MRCHPTAGNWRSSQARYRQRRPVITLGIYSVSSGAQLRAWTAPTQITSGLGASTLSWLSGGRQLVFSASEFTASSAYYLQLRTLDVTGTGTDLMAASRALLTVNNAGASTCALAADHAGRRNRHLRHSVRLPDRRRQQRGLRKRRTEVHRLPPPRPPRARRVLYQYRGACHNGVSFTLWTDASASSIIGVTRINPANEGGKEADQVGVITGGHFRPLNIAKSVSPHDYATLAF